MSVFPPHSSIPSVPVSQEIALKLLSTYLEKTNTSPHLLPNAKLEPSGPTAGSSTSSVTIHNLQRIEAGLKGEWLAPTLELESEYGGPDATVNEVKASEALGGNGEEEGWQDLGDYQREQSVDEGSPIPTQVGVVHQANPSVELEIRVRGEGGENQAGGESEAPKAKKLKTKHTLDAESTERTKVPKDKEARKREKAARNDKLKKEKEQKRKEAAAKVKVKKTAQE